MPTANSPSILKVCNLRVRSADTQILHGLNLHVQAGEVHALMGRNGSGKSTFARALVGDPQCTITGGELEFKDGIDLKEMDVDQRARLGLFLAFQYPVEVPGLDNNVFLRSAYNAMCEQRGLQPLDALEFDDLIQSEAAKLGVDRKHVYRSLNADFSGGEKKRNEMLQMAILLPTLSVLDEIDSGLDIDALKDVANAINRLRSKERAMILITHYHRILEHVVPDHVHILDAGRIVASGDAALAKQVEREGYEAIIDDRTSPKL
ncbi:MAG: Fe-S cluster assembly ATPase SufC [Pseudomonadota bacterium]|nr:Fe-S cluster assembly ATPase SufC [Pseudomonadota bacterium]